MSIVQILGLILLHFYLYDDIRMFTGIVTHQVEILDRDGGHFVLSKPDDVALHIGQSVSHDGACMTVEMIEDERYGFFAMQESLDLTTLGSKQVGDHCNMELGMQMGERLDGHVVTGHIDTTGTVTDLLTHEDGSLKVSIIFDERFDPLIIPKGSIVINGVSLTVVDVKSGGCSVWLIPITQQITNLGALEIGSGVNLEYDMMGKYITQWGRK